MTTEKKRSISHPGNGYECKTCKRRFDTFQALGGHQGTHKRVKLSDNNDACMLNLDLFVPKSLGLHRCKTCMKGFSTGQALGGHMRKHRIEKGLVLMEEERLWQRQEVDKAERDLVLAAVELQRLKADEEKRHEVKSELVLAAKEWGLSV
ncbi:hypothetical protein L1987_77035 [Smallanthus sonchifolius]|uniref:Uncharacterized protein n=1 Tax=Smallanthus sonchifolius TaxID=185202 RepID=A0ACB8Z9Q3_9ASTR|nr:hypothetical protein L1987_77035 [Smallanthus sonchifolius]